MSRIRADKFVNSGANGAPQLTYGAEVVAGGQRAHYAWDKAR